MRKYLTALVLLVMTASAFGQSTKWFKGDFDQACEEAAKKNKLVIVYGWSNF